MKTTKAFQIWCEQASLTRRPATRKFYAQALRILQTKWPKDVKTEDVTQAQVIAFVGQVQHHAPSMFNTLVSALKNTLGSKAGFLKRKPMKINEKRPPTQTEFEELLKQCDQLEKSPAGLVIRFLALSGLRIGEAHRLKWSDVREDSLLIRADTAKSGRPRIVPLVKGMQEVIADLRKLEPERAEVLPVASVRKGLQKACKRAGLTRYTHHDLRHLFATRCLESGVDAQTVARWLGHSDGGALLGRMYFHLMDQHTRDMAAKVKIR